MALINANVLILNSKSSTLHVIVRTRGGYSVFQEAVHRFGTLGGWLSLGHTIEVQLILDPIRRLGLETRRLPAGGRDTP